MEQEILVENLISALENNNEFSVFCFLDDDKDKQGQSFGRQENLFSSFTRISC